ncbi:MAG TPA: fasciclin domain-containing protein [Gemmatimonas sp.]|nr:fasciclin domain-containing protein [Gemmatimonas sp.]
MRVAHRSSHLAFASLLCIGALTPVAPAGAQHATRSASIPQVARTAGQFTTLLAAVDAAGLTETLLGRGPFTLFAPTDEAFRRLPGTTVRDLLRAENREKLATILNYHVVAGRVTAAQASALRSAETVAGQSVRISTSGDELRINDATVRIADVPASNGLIHVIDRVLLPTDDRAGAANTPLDLIAFATDRGSRFLHSGQPDASVAVYELATNALLAPGSGIPNDVRQLLRHSLADTRTSPRDRAFALRVGLDDARIALRERGDRDSPQR